MKFKKIQNFDPPSDKGGQAGKGGLAGRQGGLGRQARGFDLFDKSKFNVSTKILLQF